MKIQMKRIKASIREIAASKYGYFFWVVVLSVLCITVLFNSAGMHYGFTHTPYLLNIIGGAQNTTKTVGLLLLPDALAIVAVLMPKPLFGAGKYWPFFKVYLIFALLEAAIVALAEWESMMQLAATLHFAVAVLVAGTIFCFRITLQWVFAVAGDLMLDFNT